MKKRNFVKVFCVLLTLAIAAGMLPLNATAQESVLNTPPIVQKEELQPSGNSMPVNIQEVSNSVKTQEILKKLHALRSYTVPSNVYATTPAYSKAPYVAGLMTSSYLQHLTDHVNYTRYVAGLQPVQHDIELSANAQFGSTLMAATRYFAHSIPLSSKPADMPQAFFNSGNDAVGSSNIGGGHASQVLFNYSCLNDSDPSNIDRVGHRSSLLSASMGKIGFGKSGIYSTTKVFDSSGAGLPAGEYITWPSEGVFPLELIDHTYSYGDNLAWSFTYDRSDYSIEGKPGITLTRMADNRKWMFGSAGSGEYYKTQNYGKWGYETFIFRPATNILNGNTYKSGDVFEVAITGLKRVGTATPVTISYSVEIIDTALLTDLKISPASATPTIGKTVNLSAVKTPSNSLESVTWSSSNTNIATVSSSGVVTAKANGTVTITAKAINGKTATCTINVTPPLTDLKVSPTSSTVFEGKTVNLSAVRTPSNSAESITWSSSNTTVATVSSSGVVTAKKSGTVTITVSSANGKTAACQITVSPILTDLKVSPTSSTIYEGKTVTLSAVKTPSNSTETITWSSSNTDIATVSSGGVVTAKKGGTVTITAKAINGKTATSAITVSPVLTDLKVSPTSSTIFEGKTVTLSAAKTPSNSAESITWSSSDTSVATVSSSGVVTAKKSGTATITAKATNGKTAACTITVSPILTDLKVSPTSSTIFEGKTLTLSTVKTPSNSTESITWSSSNTNVATVSSSGVVTAKKSGTATITAKATNGKTATSAITVSPVLTDLKISPASSTVYEGKTVTLSAAKTPSNSAESITWSSSDTSVATVSSSGVVTAKKSGTATITAKATNGKTATCKITVSPILTDLKVSPTSSAIYEGKTVTVSVTKTPSNSTETITWSSSNTNVATVSSSGVVTARKSGTATITAKATNGKTATCKITVNPILTDLKISPSASTVAKGKTLNLSAVKTPSNSPETITWSSSNTSVATVSSSGVVTANENGTATITAKATNGKTATCKITVSQPLTGLKVSPSSSTLAKGKTVKLSAVKTPSNSAESITWSSSNKNVAIVSSSGVVTAKKDGTATITAKSTNGKTATCKITVNSPKYVSLRIDKNRAIQNGVKTSIDKQGTKPFAISGRTMVPVRFISEKMGGKVTYKNAKTPITIKYKDITIELTINQKKMKVTQGKTTKTITLDVAAQVKNNRTYIPLRAISQALGFNVYYHSSTKTIIISEPKSTSAQRKARIAEAKSYITK